MPLNHHVSIWTLYTITLPGTFQSSWPLAFPSQVLLPSFLKCHSCCPGPLLHLFTNYPLPFSALYLQPTVSRHFSWGCGGWRPCQDLRMSNLKNLLWSRPYFSLQKLKMPETCSPALWKLSAGLLWPRLGQTDTAILDFDSGVIGEKWQSQWNSVPGSRSPVSMATVATVPSLCPCLMVSTVWGVTFMDSGVLTRHLI